MKSYIATVAIAVAACASPSPVSEAEETDRAKERAQSSLSTRKRVVGLMSLPQLFGDHSCDTYAPSDVVLYAEPDSSRPLGVIRVAQPWTMHEHGGCEGLRVVVELASSDSAAEFPTLEYDYEMPGAVVVNRRDDWFNIRLAEGEAWIRGSSESRFIPIEDLLKANLAYVAEPDGKGLSSVPGTADRHIGTDLLTTGRSARVLESRTLNVELWLKVALQSHSPCESSDEPLTVAEGWLPAHTQAGRPIVWFYSRGC